MITSKGRNGQEVSRESAMTLRAHAVFCEILPPACPDAHDNIIPTLPQVMLVKALVVLPSLPALGVELRLIQSVIIVVISSIILLRRSRSAQDTTCMNVPLLQTLYKDARDAGFTVFNAFSVFSYHNHNRQAKAKGRPGRTCPTRTRHGV